MPDTHDPFTRTLKGDSCRTARQRIEASLRREGFGVLGSIDVQAMFRSKLDVESPGYTILEACDPALVFRAMAHSPAAGLVMPCHVVVRDDGEGGSVVSLLDPDRMARTLP
ncbi:MAG: DUF302 domain-containing protein, partial [Candidatus Eisenbacteria bacterium]